MMKRAERVAVVAGLALAIAGPIAACSGSADDEREQGGPSITADVQDPRPPDHEREHEHEHDARVPYALLDGSRWELLEAIDLPPDHLIAQIGPVPTDWYAEYDRSEPSAIPGGVRVRRVLVLVSGRPVSLDSYRTTMEGLGFSLASVDTALGPAMMGATAETGARPSVVTVPVDDVTVELLSYDLTADELLPLVSDLQLVDADAWRAAGGQVH